MATEDPTRAPFSLPEIQVNPSGWGPSSNETKLGGMPYQPFSKSDRLGKVRNIFHVLCLGFANEKFYFSHWIDYGLANFITPSKETFSIRFTLFKIE